MTTKLDLSCDSLDAVPEQFHELYTQGTDGKFALPWAKEIASLKNENGARRISEKAAKDRVTEFETKLAAYTGLGADPSELQTKLDRMAELEASSKGRVPEEKLNELAEQRANAKLVPVQKELQTLKANLAERDNKIRDYQQAADRATILEAVRAHAGPLGFQEMTYAKPDGALALMALGKFAVVDGQVVASENSGFAQGSTVKDVLPEILSQHPYLGKPSEGGGASGSGNSSSRGPNVFHSNNMTDRMRLMKENPKEFDRQMKAAGARNPMDMSTVKK